MVCSRWEPSSRGPREVREAEQCGEEGVRLGRVRGRSVLWLSLRAALCCNSPPEYHRANDVCTGSEGKVWTPLVEASKMSVHMPIDAAEQTKGFAFVEYGSQKVSQLPSMQGRHHASIRHPHTCTPRTVAGRPVCQGAAERPQAGQEPRVGGHHV